MRAIFSSTSRLLSRGLGLKSGLGTVAGWLNRWFGAPSDERVEVRMPDGLWMRFDPREFIGRHLYWMADYDPKIWGMLARHLQPGDRVVEVGAHCGTYGLRVAKQVGPQGRAVLVEPNPSMTPDLEWGIERNRLESATVLATAVGSVDGEAQLLFSGSESVTATLKPESVHGAASTRRVNVSVDTLETIIEKAGLDRIDILKVDAEGLDDEIVEQATNLDPLPRCILFEQHHDEGVEVWSRPIMTRLAARGYSVEAIAKSWFRLRCIQFGMPVPRKCFDFVAIRHANTVQGVA